MATTNPDTYAVLDRAYYDRSTRIYYLRIRRVEGDAIAQMYDSDENGDPINIPLGGEVCCRPSVALALARIIDANTRLGSWDNSNAAAFNDLKGDPAVTQDEINTLVQALVGAVPAVG